MADDNKVTGDVMINDVKDLFFPEVQVGLFIISGIYAVSEQFKTVKIQPQLFTNAFNGPQVCVPRD